MKKLLPLILIFCLLFPLAVSAEDNNGGLLPLQQAIFSGASTVEDTGWSAEGGELTLQKTGGFAGNNYLQIDLPLKNAAKLSFNVSPYVKGETVHTLSIYFRFSGLAEARTIALTGSVGSKKFTCEALKVEPNRWTRFSIVFTPEGAAPLVIEIPEGLCTKICMDALTLSLGGLVINGGKTGTDTSATTTETATVKTVKPLASGTKRALIWGICCAVAGLAIAGAILFLPPIPLPKFVRSLKEKLPKKV